MDQQNKRSRCPDCGSSDGLATYSDHTYCFACEKYSKNKTPIGGREDLPTADIAHIYSMSSEGMPDRKISAEVVNFFEVKVTPDAHYYPYYTDNEVTAYKKRILPKDFRFKGSFNMLFGQPQFQRGGRMIVITEGEIDAMSVAQASYVSNGKIWPVVSIPSANQLKPLLENRDWVRSFDTVVLWFDFDEAGKEAINKAAKIIGYDKVKVVQPHKLSCKDANEFLQINGGEILINNLIWKATPFNPAGIISGEKIWDQFVERQNKESIPYPQCLDGINDKVKGIRHGEITLFTSGTGSGKSTVIKEIILHLLNITDDKIGLISLEESVGDTAEKFIGMAINRNLSEEKVDEEDLRRGFEKVFNDGRLALLDHQGSVGDSSLIDKIEYMALMGCKYLVLDHITIAVSEGTEGLEGNAAIDKVMSDLLKLTKKHNIWLGVISHLRKSGGKAFEEGNMASIDDVKGSGSIKQISFDIIAFSRNLTATNEVERNVVKFTVLKSRFTGKTGPAGSATYNTLTGRLINNETKFSISQ